MFCVDALLLSRHRSLVLKRLLRLDFQSLLLSMKGVLLLLLLLFLLVVLVVVVVVLLQLLRLLC